MLFVPQILAEEEHNYIIKNVITNSQCYAHYIILIVVLLVDLGEEPCNSESNVS